MHSHFQKKFLKETFPFSGCWLFLKKCNNESALINITPRRGLSPHKYKNKFVSTKFWQATITRISNTRFFMQNVYMHITSQIKKTFMHVLSITTSLDFYREVIKWIENKFQHCMTLGIIERVGILGSKIDFLSLYWRLSVEIERKIRF